MKNTILLYAAFAQSFLPLSDLNRRRTARIATNVAANQNEQRCSR